MMNFIIIAIPGQVHRVKKPEQTDGIAHRLGNDRKRSTLRQKQIGAFFAGLVDIQLHDKQLAPRPLWPCRGAIHLMVARTIRTIGRNLSEKFVTQRGASQGWERRTTAYEQRGAASSPLRKCTTAGDRVLIQPVSGYDQFVRFI